MDGEWVEVEEGLHAWSFKVRSSGVVALMKIGRAIARKELDANKAR